MTDQTAINKVWKLAQQYLMAADQNTLADLIEKITQATGMGKEKDTEWQEWVDSYFRFREKVGSPVMDFTGRDAASLKRIRTYLMKLTDDDTSDNPRALAAWQYVHEHWKTLSPFLQGMIKLPNMEKYLDEIVMKLNPNGAGKTKQESARIEQEAYRRNLAKRLAAGTGATPEADQPH